MNEQTMSLPIPAAPLTSAKLVEEARNSVAPLIVEAERVVRAAIAHYSLSVKAEKIVITVQSRGRKNALGWFWAGRWQASKVNGLHEINLCAETLNTCDVGELIIHELAHAENQAKGIKDCDKTGRVHNKKFKAMAEALGLLVEPRHKTHGFAFTKVGEGAKSFLDKCAFNREVFTMARICEAAEEKGEKGAGSRLVKVECPGCGYVLRTTRKWLDVGLPTCCCGEEMQESDGGSGGEAEDVSDAD